MTWLQGTVFGANIAAMVTGETTTDLKGYAIWLALASVASLRQSTNGLEVCMQDGRTYVLQAWRQVSEEELLTQLPCESAP